MLISPIFLFVGILANPLHYAKIPKMPNHLTEKETKNATMTTEMTLDETKVNARNTTLHVESYTSSKEKSIQHI